MIRIILKRILLAIPVLLAVATITFFLIKQAPGGPFDAEKAVSPQVLKNLNAAYNLDASQWEQYTDYMTGIVQGDFGPSFRYPGRSVTEMILTGLPVTFELAIYAILIALVIGVFSGVLAALKRNTALDFIPMAIAMIGICVPTFLMGPLLVLIFGINLELLPVSGWNQIPGDKILPSLTLGFAYAAYIARLSRGGMLEVLNQDFIRTARAKGLAEGKVILKHALRNSLLPVITVFAAIFPAAIGGSIIIEVIFSIPGMGVEVYNSILNYDYPMIITVFTISAFLTMLGYLVSDLLYAVVDPRISYK